MAVRTVFNFTSKNVFTNLAAEERLFQRGLDRALLFYVNRECVVIGRTQNPFKEVDVAHAADHQIPIARRRSGGGTVVHDEGNLNFCFIKPRSEHEPLKNAKFVAAVLKEDFGIRATVNHRADILVDGKKVSGAAYRISRDRAYHHGTLLINSDLDRLRRVIKSPLQPALETLGAASVSSPVTNLSDHYGAEINPQLVLEAIADRLPRTSSSVQKLSSARVERDYGSMQSERGELCSHAWVYGQTPRFSYTYDVDGIQLKLGMTKGCVVADVEFSADGDTADEAAYGLYRQFLERCVAGSPFHGPLLADKIKNSVMDGAVIKAFGNEALAKLQQTTVLALTSQIPGQFWREGGEGPQEEFV